MLQKTCEYCEEHFEVKDTKAGRQRRFCGPLCSRRWMANNRSDSWRKKVSESQKGEGNPMYGKTQTNPNSLSNLRNDYWIGKTQSTESNEKRSKALTGIKRSEETKKKMSEAKTKWIPDDPEYTKWTKYRRRVYYWTNKNDLEQLENYSQRSLTGYHLDHKYSIAEGFKNNIPPEVIGCFGNLEMLTMKENCSKGSRCSITQEQLYGIFGRRN